MDRPESWHRTSEDAADVVVAGYAVVERNDGVAVIVTPAV